MASTTAYPAVTPSPISIPGPGSPTQFRTRTRTRTYSQSHPPQSPSPSPSRQLDSPSPSPSNSSFLSHSHAYSPQKPPQSTPNAHPYAIKTTSTALLSRSTSSSASVGVHRYVPLHGQGQSPSPTGMGQGQGEGSPTKEGRQGRHRYSRSLTGEMPLPLPPPPGAASGNGHGHGHGGHSHSNSTPGGFTSERRRSGFISASDGEDDDTPRRRGVRAETLPSGPFNAVSPGPGPGAFTSAPVQASFPRELEPEPELPDDPKTWKPAQLATYLASTPTYASAHAHAHGSTPMGTGAGAGAGDALALAVGYVQRKQVTGRAFMRLAEADLESNALPAPTRAALLAASRSLRQRVMRGRIWGSEARPQSQSQSPFPTSNNNNDGDGLEHEHEHDFNSNNPNGTSSPFSLSLSRKNGVRPRPGRRSRHSSIASDSSDASLSSNASSSGGRVRDMVDELERTRLQMDEETAEGDERERRSPVKPVRRESASPTKTHRLPQRGAVTDLFGAASPIGDDANLSGYSVQKGEEEEDKDGDSTITGLARRNVHAHAHAHAHGQGQGKEPRLLPFPPTHAGGHGGVLLTPVHTGAQYVLPSSPEAVQSFPFVPQPQGTPGPADYELGFRHALSPHLHQQHQADPHSQAYVVRHGASPDPSAISTISSNGSGSNGNGKTARPARMLPYPPVVGHAALYHPRPRRVIGVGDESSGGLDVSSGDVSATSTTSDTEAWETATEGPSASEVGSIRQKRHVEPAEDEMSIEELLADDGAGAGAGSLGPISGVAAWEMELGETVKRIAGSSGALPDANMDRNANAASVHEIGRKAGRVGTGRGVVGSVRAGTNRDKDKDKGDKEKSGGGKMKRGGIMALFDPPPEEALEVREDAAPDVPEKDAKPEGIKDIPTAASATATAHLAARENAVQTREDALDERERLVSVREVEVGRREREVVILETDVEGREKMLSTAEREIEEKEMQLRTAQSRIVEREMGVEEREEGVRCAEEGVDERVRRVEEREGELEARECELAERERGVEEARGLGQREREEVERRVREVQERERVVGERERELLDMEMEAQAAKGRDKAVSVSVQSDTPSTSHASVSTSADADADADAEQPELEGPTNPSRPAPYLTSPWAIKRDYILGRFMGVLGFSAARARGQDQGRGRRVDRLGLTNLNLRGLTGLAGQGGGYLVLMSIGVCVVVLRVLGRRVGGFVGGAAAAAGGGRR
ncbi:hypothetical protein GALMADRAFT_253044 [Galerina marginata CBS 339.88]|uniref:Uncharacterized protein n=1 Tax=Galerina marginata (strain CBS 339.88) TaxID=685588 RepID=A0A067SZL3_GALM3|nr:hypothetical protein GALMADRAFT_253044 [Galerina marginata CBS 339.88]